MPVDESKSTTSFLRKFLVILFSEPSLDVLAAAWKTGKKLWQGLIEEGMYEVLEYESTLELIDAHGEQAQFHKRQKVRYLQNGILAYQDQAWGDGEILLDYQCSPGVVVDRYRPGPTTYLLISLREVKKRGDIDEFHINWGICKGFKRSYEQWETEISHRAKHLKTHVVFPKGRPPLRATLVEYTRRRTKPLGQEAIKQLPDGRWAVTYEIDQPRLYERYILKWEW